VYLGKLQQQRKKSHISKVILRYFGYIIRQRHHNTSAASWQHLFSKFMTANITQMAKITSAAVLLAAIHKKGINLARKCIIV
jgi:hypothetical protein